MADIYQMPLDPAPDPYGEGLFLHDLQLAMCGDIEWPRILKKVALFITQSRLESALTCEERRAKWPDEDYSVAAYDIEWTYYDGEWPLVVRRDPVSRLADLGVADGLAD